MQEIHVTDFTSLHNVLVSYRQNKRWVFRGHSNATWGLLPKAGRPPYNEVDDRKVFESWKRRAIEYVRVPPASDWDWLSIAQHHGLATRLLDWTINPLNAAYFAIREECDSDAVVYAVLFHWQAEPDKYHPMEHPVVAVFRPRGVVPRITRQGGFFSIHPKPAFLLESDTDALVDMHRIIIAKEHRTNLLAELSYYGINSATLFPDLDGLSEFVNWTIRSKEYWNIQP